MKNKKMGILAVLVMLVAVTLNAVGGTYAKYISSYGMTDEARVAKWDFADKSENTVDLFQNSYSNPNGTYVASSDAWKVIAPGTSGVYEYSVEGTAETNFKVVETLKIDNKVQLENGYDPLEFRVGGTGDWVKADKIEAVNSETVYPANASIKVGGKIEWRWVFETGNDDFDTQLGALVVANPEKYTVSVTIGTTVEQTQDAATAWTNAAGDYIAPAAYASVTNRLTDAQKADLVEVGYKTQNASTTFNGKTLSGEVRAYAADDKLVSWFGVSNLDTNYFVALSITVPAGATLYNTSAYEGEKVIYKNTTGADVNFPTVINVRSLTGTYGYALEDTNGTKTPYSIAYALTEMAD